MKRTAVTFAALVCTSSLQAHHSMAMFDVSAPIWVKGTVVRYEHKNPHVIVTLDQMTEGGQVRRLIVEGPNLLRIGRMGVGPDFLKAGDVIEICGFPYKKEFLIPDAPRPAIHAHMVILPDGHPRLFGAYGKLDNCVRSGDTPDSWVSFLNTDPLAREAWCRNRNLVTVRSIAPKPFLEEIDRRMANPCDYMATATNVVQRLAESYAKAHSTTDTQEYTSWFFRGFTHPDGGILTKLEVARDAYTEGQAYWRDRPTERDKVFTAYGYVRAETEGVLSLGDERSSFTPTNEPAEQWWFSPLGDGKWSALRPGQPEPVDKARVRVEGYLSSAGHYGHLTAYGHEILVTSFTFLDR